VLGGVHGVTLAADRAAADGGSLPDRTISGERWMHG
jgi:hypothetical protein